MARRDRRVGRRARDDAARDAVAISSRRRADATTLATAMCAGVARESSIVVLAHRAPAMLVWSAWRRHCLRISARRTWQSTVALVEEVLARARPRRCREPASPTRRRCTRGGSARARRSTRVTLVSRTEFTHLRVCAIVMTLDGKVDRPALLTRTCSSSMPSLCGAAFATDGDQVLLVAERSTLDLDRSEVLELIRARHDVRRRPRRRARRAVRRHDGRRARRSAA